MVAGPAALLACHLPKLLLACHLPKLRVGVPRPEHRAGRHQRLPTLGLRVSTRYFPAQIVAVRLAPPHLPLLARSSCQSGRRRRERRAPSPRLAASCRPAARRQLVLPEHSQGRTADRGSIATDLSPHAGLWRANGQGYGRAPDRWFVVDGTSLPRRPRVGPARAAGAPPAGPIAAVRRAARAELPLVQRGPYR